MQRSTATLRLSALALGLSTGFAPASAQEKQGLSDALVREEIEFARGLAEQWGFVDMAQRVISESEAAGVSERMADELALLKCELFASAARSDSTRRDELLAQALAAYREFTERRPFSELLPVAEAQLVSVAGFYAKSLSLRLEDSAGEEADKVRTELQGVLEDAIAQSNKLISGLRAGARDERSEADNARLFELLLNLGDMYLELGKTQDEPTFSFAQSFGAYEDLIDEAGETSPAALRAFVGLGDNLISRGEIDEAAGYYEYVVELAMPRDPDAWKEAREGMSADELEKRFLYLQLATDGLVRALASAGDYDQAVAAGLHLYNSWKREGLNLQQPLGYLALLSVSRAMLDSGGWVGGNWTAGEGEYFATPEAMTAKFSNRRDQKSALEVALSIAQTVNSDNKGNTLQLRAQKVISEIISRPGVSVDPEILFEAAQGDYFAKDYSAASESFKRVLAVLERAEASKRTEIGPKLLWHLGRSYQFQERWMEAAVTFQSALERYSGDPEFDARNSSSFYDVMRELQRTARGDTTIQEMFQRSEELVARYQASAAGDIAYRNAEKAYGEKDFAEALELYKQVPVDAEGYEKALVFIGVCLERQGDLAGAEKAFDAYLNTFLEDPKNQTTDARKLARRSEAQSSAVFYWGRVAHKLAKDGQGEWSKVIELYSGYEDTFPEQERFAPAAMFSVIEAYEASGQRQRVREVYEKMTRLYPESQFTGGAAKLYYDALKRDFDKEQDPEKKKAILREMAENLEVLNRTSPKPSYTNMRTEAGHWMDLSEWEKAEAVYESVVQRFGEGPDAEDVQKFVVPKLGEAYLMLRKPAKVVEVLAAQVDSKKATRSAAQTYARALAGWAHFTPQGAVQVETGLGTAESLTIATGILQQLETAADKWTADFYAYKFDKLYAYLLWSKLDSKKLEYVQQELGFLSADSNLGRQFKHEHMSEPQRQLYLWLAQQTQ